MEATHPESHKVLLVGINFPPEQTGIAPYSGSFSFAYSKLGNTVSVITAHPHYPEWKFPVGYGQWIKTEVLDGVRVRRLRHYVPYPPRGVKRMLSEITFGIRVAFTRWGKQDAIVLVTPALFSSAIAMMKARIIHRSVPVIVWVQDLYALGLSETGQGGALSRRVIRRVESWLLSHATRVVAIHERFAARIAVDFGVQKDNIVVIKNWTHLPEAEPLNRDLIREQLGWKNNETIVLHTGNMGVKQGLSNVVKAAKLAHSGNEKIRFILMGGGGELERLKAEGAGVSHLEFLDSVSSDDYASILASADCLLVNELEGVAEMAVPSKLTSYFTSGRPIIAATALDGITASELEASEAGLVVEAGNPDALLMAALLLGKDKAGSARFGANGKRYRQDVLSEKAAIDGFEKLLIQLITHND